MAVKTKNDASMQLPRREVVKNGGFEGFQQKTALTVFSVESQQFLFSLASEANKMKSIPKTQVLCDACFPIRIKMFILKESSQFLTQNAYFCMSSSRKTFFVREASPVWTIEMLCWKHLAALN